MGAISKGVRLARACVLAGLGLGAAASAQDRDYCPDRPGLGTPACITDEGTVSVEIGLVGWARDGDVSGRETTTTLAATLVRYGIAEHAELQVGWDGLGIDRMHDRITGLTDKSTAAGDIFLAVRRNLANPDGSGISVALMPYLTLPVGGDPVGAGDWGAGLIVPASFELSDTIGLGFTTEIAAAVDDDGDGRHFALGEVIGASAQMSDTLSATLEYSIVFDRAADAHSTQHVGGFSLAWMADDDLQFDIGANAGLDADAPDIEIYTGIAARF